MGTPLADVATDSSIRGRPLVLHAQQRRTTITTQKRAWYGPKNEWAATSTVQRLGCGIRQRAKWRHPRAH
eukprot:3583919-Lingulodinium_polyedra.AAC.1